MRYIFKGVILLQFIIDMATNSMVPFERLLVILLIIGFNVFKERFYNSNYLVLFEFVCITLGVYFDMPLQILYGLIIYDFISNKGYIWVLFVLGVIVYLEVWRGYYLLPFIITISGLFAFVIRKMEEQGKKYESIFDNERRLRYSLETAKGQLLKSQEEIAHITEIKERNRIAREIHDNIGHSIAGVLIQLQAALKVFDKDKEKANDIIKKCVLKLSETLTVLRNTVHNLKPTQKMGLEYIQEIIDDFKFCQTKFIYSGDFEIISPRYMIAITKTIKEALTNTAKHSKATKVLIQLDVNEKLVRLLIKDNGVGCTSIKEGLGVSGMKERFSNLGGSLSVCSKDGFMIVCILYNKKEVTE